MPVDVSPKPSVEPEYMGDGLYATFDGYQIELYASNGVARLATVYLDPYVYQAVRAYGAKIWGLKP